MKKKNSHKKSSLSKRLRRGGSIFILSIIHLPLLAQYNMHRRESFKIETKVGAKRKHEWVNAVTVPAALTAGGLYAASAHKELFFSKYEVREERNEELPTFAFHADNYLQYAPIVAVYGLNMMGVKGKNDFANRTALMVKSEIVMTVLTYSIKNLTHVHRPDTGAPNSFPSGHTAQAFMAATFMSKEYGDQSIWYSVAAYATATSVGALRVLNNRHWVSDVMVGAAVGIFSTNLVYLTHQYKWGRKRRNTVVMPTYTQSGPGLYLQYTFR